MACPHSMLKINIKFNTNNEILSFAFEGKEDPAQDKDFENFFLGMTPDQVIKLEHQAVTKEMVLTEEEDIFFLCFRLEAFQAAMAAYVGTSRETIDAERCLIERIEQTPEGNTMTGIILPPQNFPKIENQI